MSKKKRPFTRKQRAKMQKRRMREAREERKAAKEEERAFIKSLVVFRRIPPESTERLAENLGQERLAG